jgi:hypothetical protein
MISYEDQKDNVEGSLMTQINDKNRQSFVVKTEVKMGISTYLAIELQTNFFRFIINN